MRELFKKHFALTDKGAKDLQKASAASFFACTTTSSILLSPFTSISW